MKKRPVSAVIVWMLCAALMSGCGSRQKTTPESGNPNSVSVYLEEEGNATGEAFFELFDIDRGKLSATVVQAKDMIKSVAADEGAIGCISVSSLDDTVKALQIDGADASVENVKSGVYGAARVFNIATKGFAGAQAQDFVNFIMSAEGQTLIEENGYIAINKEAPSFTGADVSGRLTVAGSAEIAPVMEKLAEAYRKVNKKMTIKIEKSDSDTGMALAAEGKCDIGMASRELKDRELEGGLMPVIIAQEGIALIVNNSNPAENVTSEQVRKIYAGEIKNWDEVL